MLQSKVHFLDFETMGTAIPIFDQSRPYQQLVFQYSLHIQNINEVLLKYRVHSTNYSKIKRNEYDQKFSAIFKKKNK